ncbi:MAG: hypothetical protein K6T83_17250 [Alicyclobacillus sp.]|nr:hypothetical protein [Alicyclobacillus sp.]
MVNRSERHEAISDLGFTVKPEDWQAVIDYPGRWVLTGPETLPSNFWAVTMDGRGHPVTGRKSPQEVLDWAINQGWECAYVAPYGRHVVGELDDIQLHDWLRDYPRRQQPVQ